MAKSISSTKSRSAAFVLPTIILLAAVLVLLTGAVLNLGTGGLRAASHDLGAEQAAYASEFGLVRAAAILASDGELEGALEGTIADNGSSYTVSAYANPDLSAREVLPGIILPPGTVYLRSRGVSSNRVVRESGALFRVGLGAFQVGALADSVTGLNATFDAYDSSRASVGYTGPGVDPASRVNNQGILASNRRNGTIFDLTDTTVEGTVFVGPGGIPNDSTIRRNGETVVANQSTLQSEIAVEKIEVPDLPPGEGDEAEFEPEDPVVRRDYAALTVQPSASGPVSFGNSCFNMTVQPNGDFVATESPGSGYAGGNLRVTGNIHDIRAGGSPTTNTGSNRLGGTGFNLSIVDGSFSIKGSWHTFSLDSSGQLVADRGPGNLVGNSMTGHMPTQTFSNAPDWLVHLLTGAGGGVEADTPPELAPGEYDKVTVDGGNTNLADKGVYVVKDLNITNGGTLSLPSNRSDVVLYVTGSLTVEGEDAIANMTRRAPNLKIFYTGPDAVKLEGGSKSYFTLMAPNANLSLVGDPANPTEFFGALVGRQVTVQNAAFHYDVSTDGIGSGTDATPLTLLSRHR